MNADLSSLPDGALISKQDVIALENKYQEKIHYLEERIRLLQNEIFGRKSEKHHFEDHRQLSIFDSDSQQDPDQKPSDSTIVEEHW